MRKCKCNLLCVYHKVSKITKYNIIWRLNKLHGMKINNNKKKKKKSNIYGMEQCNNVINLSLNSRRLALGSVIANSSINSPVYKVENQKVMCIYIDNFKERYTI